MSRRGTFGATLVLIMVGWTAACLSPSDRELMGAATEAGDQAADADDVSHGESSAGDDATARDGASDAGGAVAPDAASDACVTAGGGCSACLDLGHACAQDTDCCSLLCAAGLCSRCLGTGATCGGVSPHCCSGVCRMSGRCQ